MTEVAISTRATVDIWLIALFPSGAGLIGYPVTSSGFAQWQSSNCLKR